MIDDRTRKFINHRTRGDYPRIIRLTGKHGNHYWIVESDEEFLAALRAMIEINYNNGYYCNGETYLAGARKGIAADVLAFANERQDAEYEEWSIEDVSDLMMLPEFVAPVFSVDQTVYLDGKIKGIVQGYDDDGDLIVLIDRDAVIHLGEAAQAKRLTLEAQA